MNLYHASRKKLDVDSTIGPFKETRFTSEAVRPKNLFYREEILESCRAEDCQSRLSAVFTFSNPHQCYAFMDAENKGTFFIYRVSSQHYSGHPMAIVDQLREGMREDALRKLTTEYWKPKRTWKFIEYLCSSVVVEEKILELDDVESMAAKVDYGLDVALAEGLIK